MEVNIKAELLHSVLLLSAEWYSDEQHTCRPAGREGRVAAVGKGTGGGAGLPQTTGSAAPEFTGAREATEQHGAGKFTCPVTATGIVPCLQ